MCIFQWGLTLPFPEIPCNVERKPKGSPSPLKIPSCVVFGNCWILRGHLSQLHCLDLEPQNLGIRSVPFEGSAAQDNRHIYLLAGLLLQAPAEQCSGQPLPQMPSPFSGNLANKNMIIVYRKNMVQLSYAIFMSAYGFPFPM